jgi:hypothetical protein
MTAKIVQAPQLRMARRISRTKVSQVVLTHDPVGLESNLCAPSFA